MPERRPGDCKVAGIGKAASVFSMCLHAEGGAALRCTAGSALLPVAQRADWVTGLVMLQDVPAAMLQEQKAQHFKEACTLRMYGSAVRQQPPV